MNSRRKFIKNGITTIAGISLLPAVNIFAFEDHPYKNRQGEKFKLRFALASDGHYAQPGTDSKTFFTDIVKWLNHEHQQNHLDFTIINGDLVHDRPDLLKEVKSEYFDHLQMPWYALPGNHDHADTALWKSVFGYADNYTMERGDIGFVFANTSDTKGAYLCPDNAFLKQSLDAFAHKQMVFGVLHIPPYQWLKEETAFANCAETIELLHSYPNLKALFHGHDHSLDGVRYTGKLPHFFDSHFGGNWGTEYKGYRIVEISENYQVFTYQVNASESPRLNSNKI